MEQKAGTIYTDAVLCRDDLGYVTKDDSVTALKRDGTIEYINEKTTFDSMLIYDVSGAVVGVLFRQQENN